MSADELPALKLEDEGDSWDKAATGKPTAGKKTVNPSTLPSPAPASSSPMVGPIPAARLAGEYRFAQACKLCGTRVDFTSSQLGSKTTCPDCFSPMEVREPGPEQERRPLSDDQFGAPESLAMEATPADARRLDAPEALKQRADQLLEKAAASLRAEQREEQDGRFSDAAAGRLLGVFSQRETLARWAALSVLGVIALGLLDWHIGRVLSETAVTLANLVVGAIAYAAVAIWFAAVATHCAAVLRGSVVDLATAIPWPGMVSKEWLLAPLRLSGALACAGLPGVMIGGAAAIIGLPWWLALPVVFLSVAVFFPVIALSMERRGGSWAIYEPGLWDDLVAVWPATATFYQATLLLAIVGGMVLGAAGFGRPWLAVFQGPILAAVALAEFRLLGWLNIALVAPPVDD